MAKVPGFAKVIAGRWRTVEMDSAGAALPKSAAEMRAAKLEIVA